MLSEFSYITIPDLTKNIKTDIKTLLCGNNKSKTYDHVKAVAEMNTAIAEQYGLDLEICVLCGYLHDISAVIKPSGMLSYAAENAWYVDEAEKKHPFLLHQRISRVIAEQDLGITDERILSAVECHTTLKAGCSKYDMALFIADKLAWDQEGRPPFYQIVNDALKQSLEEASLAYMNYIVDNQLILYPHKWFEEAVWFLKNEI